MQVLLKENIAALGARGDVVNVKPGYARNYLVPKDLAVAVTDSNLRQIEVEKKRLEKIQLQRMDDLKKVADQLSQVSLTITVKANEEGHLFGSVSEPEILAALEKENFNLDQRNLRLDEHIKEVGAYDVVADFGNDIEATFKVWVVREEA